VAQSPVGSYEALYVNIHGRPPYDLGRDPAIRRAIAYGVEKRAIVESVWRGTAESGQTLVPASLLGAHAGVVHGTEYDTVRANQLLEGAGWRPGADGVRAKHGRRLSLTLIVGFPNPEIHRPMPEVVQAELKRIGIELTIVQVSDDASYQARIRSGEGDLWAEAGGQNDANPCFLPDLLFYGGGDPGRRSAYARLFGPGPQFDRIIDACRSAVDLDQVRSAAAGAIHVLIDEEFVVIPLAGTRRLWGLSNHVGGFTPHPSSLSQRWETVWVR
jgi:peptide/nickel transport system substrate-binding protein